MKLLNKLRRNKKGIKQLNKYIIVDDVKIIIKKNHIEFEDVNMHKDFREDK